MTAEIISVGTELLLGNILNTNAQYLSRELADLGITVQRESTIGDNHGRLADFVNEAKSRCDLLVFTGGLGPTADDLTKETVAACFGDELVFDEAEWDKITSYFARTGRETTPNNRKQAMVPTKGHKIINNHGTAPGAWFIVDTGEVIKPAEPMTVSQTILSMVPDNPITALATGNLMQIIVFGVFIGIAITILGDRVKNVKKVIDEANIIMFKITDMVMQVTPFGVTALVACSVGEYGLSIFNILGKFILTHYIGAFSVVLFMYVFIIKYIAKISLKDFFTKITEVWLVAFSTTSSSGTLPVSLRVTEEKFKVKDELASFTLPIGATVNMNGIAVYYAVTVLFVAQVYGVELSLMQQVMFIFMTTLISIGTPGIPNSGIVLTIMLRSAKRWISLRA